MGFTKRWMESQEAERDEARKIAPQAGSLDRCDIHRDYVWDTGDPTMAYRLANKMYTEENVQNDYESRRELTDKIKRVIEDSPFDSICPSCQSAMGK